MTDALMLFPAYCPFGHPLVRRLMSSDEEGETKEEKGAGQAAGGGRKRLRTAPWVYQLRRVAQRHKGTAAAVPFPKPKPLLWRRADNVARLDASHAARREKRDRASVYAIPLARVAQLLARRCCHQQCAVHFAAAADHEAVLEMRRQVQYPDRRYDRRQALFMYLHKHGQTVERFFFYLSFFLFVSSLTRFLSCWM